MIEKKYSMFSNKNLKKPADVFWTQKNKNKLQNGTCFQNFFYFLICNQNVNKIFF